MINANPSKAMEEESIIELLDEQEGETTHAVNDDSTTRSSRPSRDRRTSDFHLSPTPFRGVLNLDAPATNSSSNDKTQQQSSHVQRLLPPSPPMFDDQSGVDDSQQSTASGDVPDGLHQQETPLRTNKNIHTNPGALVSASAAFPSSTTETNDNHNDPLLSYPTTHTTFEAPVIRSRTKNNHSTTTRSKRQRGRKRSSSRRHDDSTSPPYNGSKLVNGGGSTANNDTTTSRWFCCRQRNLITFMNFMAKMVLWGSALASTAAVIWYSYELKKHGTDPHLIAWFSAGAFVILGFPMSMYGIVSHLANYNQPNVQCYIVRILWMVPLYSIESWLCLRYKDYAIYIETLRDCYESYVLYSFLQFLIQVLGGEETLILMLKDKSPTRGVHMWGLQWCVKPWLMGQPVRKTYDRASVGVNSSQLQQKQQPSNTNASTTTLKRVHWTSPFFVKCKFGVLQYVLLKFVCSIVVGILERFDMYKEGDFTYRGGYLYICILTNLSQCWALYCMIFFYYATKNELGSIRPVGKFLSVKALVFFTWWQSVCISILYNMDLIPHYHPGGSTGVLTGLEDDDDGHFASSLGADYSSMPLSPDAALALDQFGGDALSATNPPGFGPGASEWSAEDVAKGLQDYLICIEMFVAAIVHIFVFPHTEYSPQAVEGRNRALNQMPHQNWNKRLGRKWKDWDNKSAWSGTASLVSRDSGSKTSRSAGRRSYYTRDRLESDELLVHPMDHLDEERAERKPLLLDDDDDMKDNSFSNSFDDVLEESSQCSESEDDDESTEAEDNDVEKQDEFSSLEMANLAGTATAGGVGSTPPRTQVQRTGFVKALLDSAIPQDLRDNTVGIIKGDYVVEKKTLLHHAATSDSYDLFSRNRIPKKLPRPSFLQRKAPDS